VKGRRDVERAAGLVTETSSVGHDAPLLDVDLELALQRLTPESRAVVVTRHLLGFSSAETAQVLNMPEGTVKSKLSRALDDLKGWLES